MESRGLLSAYGRCPQQVLFWFLSPPPGPFAPFGLLSTQLVRVTLGNDSLHAMGTPAHWQLSTSFLSAKEPQLHGRVPSLQRHQHAHIAFLAHPGRSRAPDCTMTLGGQPEDLMDLATQPAASQQQAQQQQQQHRKRQRRGGGALPEVEGACIVDLASQSSCELQGSPAAAAAFGGSKDASVLDGRMVRLVLLCTSVHGQHVTWFALAFALAMHAAHHTAKAC